MQAIETITGNIEEAADARPLVASATGASTIIWSCRRLSVLAGVVTAAGLFLPLLHDASRGRPILLFWVQLRESWSSYGFPTADLVFSFLGLLLCHLLGALLAAGAAARIAERPDLVRLCWQCARGLLALLGVGVLWVLPHLHQEALFSNAPFLTFSGVVLAAIALGGPFLAGRRGHRGYLVEYFALSLACLSWFAFLMIAAEPLYGVYVSLAASLVLVLCTAAEAVLHRASPVPVEQPNDLTAAPAAVARAAACV
jgi:hypothetical protein